MKDGTSHNMQAFKEDQSNYGSSLGREIVKSADHINQSHFKSFTLFDGYQTLMIPLSEIMGSPPESLTTRTE